MRMVRPFTWPETRRWRVEEEVPLHLVQTASVAHMRSEYTMLTSSTRLGSIPRSIFNNPGGE